MMAAAAGVMLLGDRHPLPDGASVPACRPDVVEVPKEVTPRVLLLNRRLA
jgi:hypothetical protein